MAEKVDPLGCLGIIGAGKPEGSDEGRAFCYFNPDFTLADLIRFKALLDANGFTLQFVPCHREAE